MQYLSTRLDLRGPISRAELEPMLSNWRDGGGVVEVRWLKAEWGPLTLSAEGTVALDERMRPLGALSSEIGGLGPTMDALAAAGVVTRNTARLAGIALGLLARTPSGGGAPVIGVPIAAQNGELYLGPVKVAALPPVIPTGTTERSETTPAVRRPEPVETSPLLAPDGPPTLDWSQEQD